MSGVVDAVEDRWLGGGWTSVDEELLAIRTGVVEMVVGESGVCVRSLRACCLVRGLRGEDGVEVVGDVVEEMVCRDAWLWTFSLVGGLRWVEDVVGESRVAEVEAAEGLRT